MSNLPSNSLFQQMRSRPVSGEHLELLGKEAAKRWSEGRHPDLSSAVVETVKEARLSPEQVKRVIEFTNTSAFLSEFNKEGTGHRYVDFGDNGIAHPSRIFQDLNDGSGGTVFDTGTGDYFEPVPSSISKHGSAVESFEKTAELDEAFAVSDFEYAHVDPFHELSALRYKLASAYETATSARTMVEGTVRDLADRMYENVKQATLEGHSLGEVANIWSTVGNADQVKVAFDITLERLYDEDVFSSVDDVVSSLQKTASMRSVPNPNHPLVTDFQEFCEGSAKLAEVFEEQQHLGEMLKQATTILTKVGNAASDAVKHVAEKAHPGGVVGAYRDLVRRAAEGAKTHGDTVGEFMMGKGKGKWVGSATRAGAYTLGYGAPIAAANQLKNTVMNNPTVRSGVNAAMSTLPGTQEYYGQY